MSHISPKVISQHQNISTTQGQQEDTTSMYVVKRDGRHEKLHFDKITSRIEKLCFGLDTKYVTPEAITLKVVSGMYSGISTRQLDDLAAETAAYMSTNHHHYSTLAARICSSNLHKETNENYLELVTNMRNYIHPVNKSPSPLVSQKVLDVVTKYEKLILGALQKNKLNDFEYDYFAFKTLERAYLLKMDDKVVETPQMMLMRVSIGMHGDDIESVLHSYELMSMKKFTMATPTLFNSGTESPQMSSCFLLNMKDDSIDGIFDTLKDCAKISKLAGGIGLNIHNIRATGSYIRGTSGTSNGIVNMLRVYNNTARYVDQGGGRRKGSFAMYLEPWHADVESFIELKKNHGNDMMRARDLFYALWIPDLFMKRVETDGTWSLMCPNEAPGLADVYGSEFESLYEKYEKEDSKVRKVMKARDLWNQIMTSQVETGQPYMLAKDSCNKKSNQKNLGTIKGSNLCTEIVQYTSPEEIAVCNLASINLASMVKNPYTDEASFEFEDLESITRAVTFNLNKVIDNNLYPIPEARNSNKKHRPIGIGVQGLADAFIMMNIPFDSHEARELNKYIFESMYYAAVNASVDLAQKNGSYSSFKGSPMSKGIFQFDMWGVKPTKGRYDWDTLRTKMVNTGLYNSLLLAPMPTASTSQILGNNEACEPFTSNIYNRRVLSGEFMVVNKHLLRELTSKNLWNDDVKSHIMNNKGSVQELECLPVERRALYKTVWELSQKVIIDHAKDRGAYVCQSQSMNIFMSSPSVSKLSSMLFYAWKSGLKTLSYYIRSRPKTDGIQFAIDKMNINVERTPKVEEEEPECLSCSA